MRSYSTPQSAQNLEITKLAIIETVAAVTLYICISMYLGTFRYLAAAVVVAPLMLFRTEVSADWGLKVYEQCLYRIERWPLFLALFGYFLVGPVLGVLIRIVATLYWAVRRPLQTLKETPQNWLRQSFCTDFLHPPEIVPLEAAKGDPQKVFTFVSIWEFFGAQKSTGEKVFMPILFSPVLVIGYLPSMIYRVSFKATAVAYVPFIWAVHTTLRNPLSLKIRLQRITNGELEKVRRGLSWIIVATLAAKVGFVIGWVDRSYIETQFPSHRFVESFVVPGGWPWWQIILGAEALLTFFLLYFADAALARLDSQQAWQEKTVLETVSTVSFLRAALSVATISYFFYLAFVEASHSWSMEALRSSLVKP